MDTIQFNTINNVDQLPQIPLPTRSAFEFASERVLSAEDIDLNDEIHANAMDYVSRSMQYDNGYEEETEEQQHQQQQLAEGNSDLESENGNLQIQIQKDINVETSIYDWSGLMECAEQKNLNKITYLGLEVYEEEEE